MSGVGSTNAMKKGSANNPFLAFSEADMASYLNSAYTGCIVKYSGETINREVSDTNKTVGEYAQNIVFNLQKDGRFGMTAPQAIKIDITNNGSSTTQYIYDAYVKDNKAYPTQITGSVPMLVLAASMDAGADIVAVLCDGSGQWQKSAVNDQGKVTLWAYSEDVLFTVVPSAAGSIDIFKQFFTIVPYIVGELYKVVYGNGQYYYEEFYYISEERTTGNSDYIAPGKTMYDFTGSLQTGNGSKINPYIANTADEMNSYLTTAYREAFIKYVGTSTDDYIKNAIYQVLDDGDTTRYAILPTLENEGTASDLASGKQLINSQGEVVVGEADTGARIVEFLAKTYSGSINDKNGDVTVLYGGQFLNQEYITEVNLPNVSVIGSSVKYGINSIYGNGYTFYNCRSLSKIILSNTISLIGGSNFANCISLKSVTFSGVSYVPTATFDNCRTLENVDMQDVTNVGQDAFEYCLNLKQLNLGAISYVGYDGFASAFAKDNDISLSFASTLDVIFSQNAMNKCNIKRLYINTTSTVTLSDYAFYTCVYLSDVNITASRIITYITGNTFCSCNNLTNVALNTYENVTITRSMFAYCTKLKWRSLSSAKITTLYGNAFYTCSALDYAYLPYLITISEGSVFAYCSSLSYVYMPIIQSINGNNIFTGCNNLKSVYIMQESGLTSVPTLQYSNALYGPSFNIYVGYTEYVSMLQSAPNWSNYSSRIMVSQFDSSVLLK